MRVKREFLLLTVAGLSTFLAGGFIYSAGRTKPTAPPQASSGTTQIQSPDRPEIIRSEFDVQVLMNGRPLDEYVARGRSYVEAIEGREYELRVRNPFPFRVAVALSVDGLNTIDAKHTTAWDASKWVIGPYETIDISGWQVTSARARHFYFSASANQFRYGLYRRHNRVQVDLLTKKTAQAPLEVLTLLQSPNVRTVAQSHTQSLTMSRRRQESVVQCRMMCAG
jgi:hypothetical protein